MPRYGQSGGFQGSAAVNRRLRSPFARGDGKLPLPKADQKRDPSSKIPESGEYRFNSSRSRFISLTIIDINGRCEREQKGER
jgi:hypothetical protein